MTTHEDPLYSPFNELLGLRIVDWTPNEIRIELALQEHHMNRSRTPHGGVLMSLLDVSGGLSGCWNDLGQAPRRAFTLSLSTQFIAIAQGTVLSAKARCLGGGRRVFFAEAKLFDEQHVLIASAQGSWKRLGDERPSI